MTFGEYLERAQQFLRDHPEAAGYPAFRFNAQEETYEVDSGPSLDRESLTLPAGRSEEGWEEGIHYQTFPVVML